MSERQARLDFDARDPLERADLEARALAVDPTSNVALEASAGTGKTRVLVERYVALLEAGVKPRHILAITFTRKAAAEMRRRILDELASRHRRGGLRPALWQELRESVTDISISTIDAFCLSLLREFPLEAGVDPGFDLADETETPRLVDEALRRALRAGRARAVHDEETALLFAELGEFRLEQGLARLIDRRLVARDALQRFLRGASHGGVHEAVARLLGRLRAAAASGPGGLAAFVATGPVAGEFAGVAGDLARLVAEPPPDPAAVQALLGRVRDHLLTREGEARKRLACKKADFRSSAEYQRHGVLVASLGPHLIDALEIYRRDIAQILARAVMWLFERALDEYERTLRSHGVLDFAEVLHRTLALLSNMDEFSRSRYKLEARYQHVLVDEFQDTSRAQWELVQLLVRSWGEGRGLAGGGLDPSIFIVGDRKQSIYGFRDAEVAVLDHAARYIEALRPAGRVRAAITHSFRAVRELLAFVNDLCAQIDKEPDRPDAFRYTDEDAFPLASADAAEPDALGLAVAASDRAQAEAVAAEIARLLASGAMVRDRDTGVRRAAGPGDIGVLFRTREGHALFEEALARRRVPFYVYKGLGFFDADEVKDLLALVGFLARPQVQVAAAAFLRSRLVRLSDAALAALAPRLSEAIVDPIEPDAADRLDGYDRRRLQLARASVPRWLALVDRVPPAELVDRVLAESAYAAEIAGPSYRQARENVKKARMLIRRMQNRGYATLGRVADQLAGLAAGGDESNAIVDAADAVNLMTVHAAKGLEFPIVFLANLHRGSGGTPDPVRVVAAPFGQEDAVEPWVAIGEHRSGPERDIEARETEETKRLLYVALTRARDRLYLAATVPANGRFMGGRGGLGHMLPASMAATIGAAAVSTAADLVWTGPRGRHRFRLVRTSDDAPVLDRSEAGAVRSGDDFAPLTTTAVRRVTVTDLVAGAAANRAGDSRQVVEQPARSPSPGEAAGDALGGRVPGDLVGRLVHRAIEADLAGHTDDETEAHALDPAIDALIRDEERGEAGDRHALIDAVGRALRALRADPVVSSLVSGHQPGGWRGCEVPFSCRLQDGTIVRGTIDCLIEHAGGRVEVVEIKTGRPRPEDDAQLELYLEAARRLFPDAPVGGRVVYAGRS